MISSTDQPNSAEQLVRQVLDKLGSREEGWTYCQVKRVRVVSRGQYTQEVTLKALGVLQKRGLWVSARSYPTFIEFFCYSPNIKANQWP